MPLDNQLDRSPKFVGRGVAAWGLALALCIGFVSQAEAQPGRKSGLGNIFDAKSNPAPALKLSASLTSTEPGQAQLKVIVNLASELEYIRSLTPSGAETVLREKVVGLKARSEWRADRDPEVIDEPDFETGKSKKIERFYHKVTFTRDYDILPDTDESTIEVKGTLSGQKCTDMECLPLENLPFLAKLGGGETTVSAEDAPGITAEFTSRANVIPVAAQKKSENSFEHYTGRKGSAQELSAAWNVYVEPKQVRPGDTVTVTVEVVLDPKWHLYGMKQDKDADGFGPTPLLLEVKGTRDLVAVDKAFIASKTIDKKSGTWEGVVERYYEKTAKFQQKFTVDKKAKPGALSISLHAEYQICKNTTCVPKDFDVAGSITVGTSASKERVKLVSNATASADAPPGASETSPGAPTTQAMASTPSRGIDKSAGLIPFLLTAVLAGFTALLTPCVFPMVPITITFFLKQSEKSHNSPFLMASVYCLGIIGTFTGLGILMSVFYSAASLTLLANNAVLNIGIAVMMIFFGLNMLGLFEIAMPSSLLTFTSGQGRLGGYLGTLFMALTFTLTSFTCTFAFAGLLLAMAAAGDWFWPTLGLLAFSTAFASPFFFLAMFPSLLKKLPKSGDWMHSIKYMMGLVELGAAFKFLSVADMTLNPVPKIFDTELVLSAWMVIAATGALFLLGIFRTHHSEQTHTSPFASLLGMSCLGLAAYLAVGLYSPHTPKGLVWENIIAFAPPRFEGGQDDFGPYLEHDGLKYRLDLNKAMAAAIKLKKPLFIDFTGVNCVNCRKMEQGPLSRPSVKERLSQFVLVQVFTDRVPYIPEAEGKVLGAQNREFQESWYGDASLPAYAIVPPVADALTNPDSILAHFQGLEQVDGSFLEFLNTGYEKYKASLSSVASTRGGAGL